MTLAKFQIGATYIELNCDFDTWLIGGMFNRTDTALCFLCFSLEIIQHRELNGEVI